MANEVTDGFISMIGGMQGGLDPLLLTGSMYARGVNVSSRDGLIHTRPGFSVLSKCPVSGNFQGMGRWSLNSGDRVVMAVAGRVLVYNLDNGYWDDLGVVLSTTADRVYFEQADKWIVAMDGITTPAVAIEESTSGHAQLYSGSNPSTSCYPPGTIMKFVFNRLHFVPANLIEQLPHPDEPAASGDANKNAIPLVDLTQTGRTVFVSSDIRDIYDPQWLFRMYEHRSLSGGGGFALPQELGFITGMSVFRNAATGTGTGPLVVFAREGVAVFDVSIPRVGWTSQPISQVLFYGAGTRSPLAIVPVNNDIMFIDADGHVRSIQHSSAQIAGSAGALSNTPMSDEISPFIRESNRSLLPYTSAAFSDNRFFFTIHGEEGPFFRGLISFDLVQVYGIGGAAPPAYDGVWTGFKFLHTLSARYDDALRSITAVLQGSEISLIWLDEAAMYDPADTRIESSVLTRYFNFGAAASADSTKQSAASQNASIINLSGFLKELDYVDIWLNDLYTPVDFEILFRPTSYPKWTSLGTKSLNVVGALPQVRRRLRYSVDKDTVGCNIVSGEKLYAATEFQFALKWKGHCQISKFQVFARALNEAPPECSEDNPEDISLDDAAGVDIGDFEYEVTLP